MPRRRFGVRFVVLAPSGHAHCFHARLRRALSRGIPESEPTKPAVGRRATVLGAGREMGGFGRWEEGFGWGGEKGIGRSTAMEDWAMLLDVEDGRMEGGWGDGTGLGEGGEVKNSFVWMAG